MKKKIFRAIPIKTLRILTQTVNELNLKPEDVITIVKEVEQYVLFYWQEE